MLTHFNILYKTIVLNIAGVVSFYSESFWLSIGTCRTIVFPCVRPVAMTTTTMAKNSTQLIVATVVVCVAVTTALGRRQVVDGPGPLRSSSRTTAAIRSSSVRLRGRDLEPPPHSCSEGRRRCLSDVSCRTLWNMSLRVCDQSST